MKRILLMVIRNLIFVPYWWIKLCWYAAHTDDYPEAEKYAFLRHCLLYTSDAADD